MSPLWPGLFGFGGSVVAVEGSRVFTNGFGLICGPASSVLLTNGTLEATASTDIGGAVVIGAGPASTIKVELNSFLDFEPTTTVLLNGDLRLISNNARILAGAAFGGSGALVVPGNTNSNLVAVAGSIINVLVSNEGGFYPGGLLSVGRTDLRDYEQSATGNLFVDLAGTSLNQFDRMIVNGDVLLDGTLHVRIAPGFVPVAGNQFNIISAFNVFDTFAQVQTTGMPNGLYIRVVYMPTFVRLVVTPTVDSDLNDDGDVDHNDVALMASCRTRDRVPHSGTALCHKADLDDDGDVDPNDFGIQQRCYSGENVPVNPVCGN